MPKRRDKYTREDGKPTFAFWRELRNLMKQIHETAEATRESQNENDRLRVASDLAFTRAMQAVARIESSR